MAADPDTVEGGRQRGSMSRASKARSFTEMCAGFPACGTSRAITVPTGRHCWTEPVCRDIPEGPQIAVWLDPTRCSSWSPGHYIKVILGTCYLTPRQKHFLTVDLKGSSLSLHFLAPSSLLRGHCTYDTADCSCHACLPPELSLMLYSPRCLF